MSQTDIFMDLLYQHFSFDPALPGMAPPFHRSFGKGQPQFMLGRADHGSYEQYILFGSFMVSLIHFAPPYTTSAFMDSQFQFLVHEENTAGNESRLHKHDHYELTYVVDGQLDLVIEGNHYRMMAGDACIVNDNARHQELRSTEYTAIYIGMKSEFFKWLSHPVGTKEVQYIRDFLFRNQNTSDQVDYLIFLQTEAFGQSAQAKRFQTLFVSIISELLGQEIGYMELCRVYLYRIFTMLQNPTAYLCSNTRLQFQSADALFERTLQYLFENKRKISRSELEKALSYNGTYINRVFQKHLGQTLAAYNRDVCLREAARLLLNTKMSAVEICHQIGYENKTVFYQLFKKKYGATPQQYRKQGIKAF